MANMNRSRKRHEQGRKIPSRIRTEGRIKRYESRHPGHHLCTLKDCDGGVHCPRNMAEVPHGAA